MSTQTTERTVNQILETLSQRRAQAMANSPASSYRDRLILGEQNYRQLWISRRLGLVRHHPDLEQLENAIFEFCQGVAKTPRRGKRTVIFGNNGNGKSRCCKAVKRWVDERAIDLPLVPGDEGMRLVDCCLVNWAATVNQFKGGDWSLDHMIDASVLIVDDVGAEHDPSRMAVEKLYLILEARERRWTVVTTNVPPANWEHRFDRRVSDRLFRNSVHVDLSNVPSYSINT